MADEFPIGWEMVSLTAAERDALTEAADEGRHDEAEKIVKGAYDRLFGDYLN